MNLPMGLWRPYLGILLGLDRPATEAEVRDHIRRHNARFPEPKGGDIKIGDIERDNSEAIARWWKR